GLTPPVEAAAPPVVLDVPLERLMDSVVRAASVPDVPPAAALDVTPPHSYFRDARIVSVYGHPDVCFMGELGCHDPEGAARRAEELASLYRAEDGRTTLAALHLIVYVAQASPGPDGSYLGRMSLERMQEWVEVARDHARVA